MTMLLFVQQIWCQTTPQGVPYRLQLGTQIVLLDASVTEKRTNILIGNLTAEDFTLTEDKIPQKIASITVDRLPLSISLLFDLTDTVQPVLEPLAEGAHQVLTHLRPEDEVAVMTFSNHVDLLQPFTQDHRLVEDAILLASQRHDKNMATFIHEAVYSATEQTTHATLPNSRRVEIWLTDGTSNYNAGFSKKMASKRGIPAVIHSKDEATALMISTGTVASVLLERSAMTDAQIAFMPLFGHYGEINDYANLTGGPVLHTSSQQVAERLASLIDALRQRYTIGYKPSVSRPQGTTCHINLELSPSFFRKHPGLAAKDVVVRTRKAYVRGPASPHPAEPSAKDSPSPEPGDLR